MRLWILLVVVALSGCVTETNNPKKKVDEAELEKRLIDLGIGYLQKREYDRAKENLNKALALNPRSPLAHTTFGVLFQLEGEDELAEDHFKKAIRYAPDFSRARNNYGAFLFQAERYEEAIEQLEVAASDRFYAARPQVFQNLGVAYLRLNNIEKAESAFIRAVELRPDQARALLELAILRFESQAYAESRRMYQQFARFSQQNSRSLWLCVRLARIFENKNDEASCSLALKNIYPASTEYEAYQRSIQ